MFKREDLKEEEKKEYPYSKLLEYLKNRNTRRGEDLKVIRVYRVVREGEYLPSSYIRAIVREREGGVEIRLYFNSNIFRVS